MKISKLTDKEIAFSKIQNKYLKKYSDFRRCKLGPTNLDIDLCQCDLKPFFVQFDDEKYLMRSYIFISSLLKEAHYLSNTNINIDKRFSFERMFRFPLLWSHASRFESSAWPSDVFQDKDIKLDTLINLIKIILPVIKKWIEDYSLIINIDIDRFYGNCIAILEDDQGIDNLQRSQIVIAIKNSLGVKNENI